MNLSELYKVREILKSVDYSTISFLLDNFLPQVPICTIDFKNRLFELQQRHAGGPNLLYRARVIDNLRDGPYKNLAEITYLSKEDSHKIKYYGRVNKPGEPMFYASTDPFVACAETISKGERLERFMKKGSEMLILGTWEITQPLTFAQLISPEKYYTAFFEEHKNLKLPQSALEEVRQNNRHVRDMLGNDISLNILEFFSEEFAKTNTEDHNEYKICNYYADRIFNSNKNFKVEGNIDGIWYPSVVASYQKNNVVFPPKIVDQKLRFLGAEIMWMTFSKEKTQLMRIEQMVQADSNGYFPWRTKTLG